MYIQIVIGCIIFLFVFGIIRICAGKKGTWSESLAPDYEIRDYGEGDSAGEKRVKNFLESYFEGYKFEKTRPFFLNNTVTGHNLELDCYNKELNLAVEYNGRQHYEYTPYFHKNKEAFQNQRYRDELKKIWCKDRGIQLIIVPYTEKNIEQYLSRELSALPVMRH